MTPRAYSYIRFSTPEQLKGDSLRRQFELSEKWAKDHGLVLDDRLKLQDLGLSAYSGKHRDKDKGALGRFLELVKVGRIPEGSVLLVESLDRLSREEITEALEQFLAIIGKGVKIVTLADSNREYTKETINANVGELIVSLTIMSRAHEESKMKAFRLGKAWQAKRDKAINGERKLTARAPAWLSLSSDKTTFSPIPDRVQVIERIFRERLTGKGTERIERDLNQDESIHWKPKSPRKEGQKGWRKSYIEKILRTRAVIGEFQPHRLIDGKRVPEGEPLKGYYPAAITEELFYQVQALMDQNRVAFGKVGKGGRNGEISNLFAHIAKCGYCGYPMQYINKGEWRYLACDKAHRRIGCHYLSVRYSEFEETVLTYCRGLDPSELLPGRDEAQSLIRALEGESATAQARMKAAAKKADNLTDQIADENDKGVRALLAGKLKTLLDEKEIHEKEADRLRRELEKASQSTEVTRDRLKSLSQLFEAMRNLEGQARADLRTRLRQELRQLIKKIDVYPGGRPLYTPEFAERALGDMALVHPEGTAEYEYIKEELRKRVENPKDFLTFNIHFSTGSVRMIHPAREPRLTLEFDKEAGVLRNWIIGPEGEEVLDFRDKVD